MINRKKIGMERITGFTGIELFNENTNYGNALKHLRLLWRSIALSAIVLSPIAESKCEPRRPENLFNRHNPYLYRLETPMMILYNVTVNIDHDVHDAWFDWMKNIHMPEVMATGKFTQCKLARILAEEDGGKSYSIQYFAPDMETYEAYQRQHGAALRQKSDAAFGGKFVAFRTLLHVLHQDGA